MHGGALREIPPGWGGGGSKHAYRVASRGDLCLRVKKGEGRCEWVVVSLRHERLGAADVSAFVLCGVKVLLLR